MLLKMKKWYLIFSFAIRVQGKICTMKKIHLKPRHGILGTTSNLYCYCEPNQAR